MKRTTLFFASILLCISLFSQDVKDSATKMDEFASQTGVIVKYEDYEMQGIKTAYSIATTKIRKISSGGQIKYFYQISSKGKYNTKTASIAYEDLLEVQKALTTLKTEADNDISNSASYLENKFVTDDGFQVGYYLSKGKINWYMRLEKYGEGNNVFPKSYDIIKAAFDSAESKMKEMSGNP